MTDRPNRKSIRLQGYDYSEPGSYFITVCVQNRQCVLGAIVDGRMVQSEAGLMVESWWGQIESKFPGVFLDAFIVMPNHVHGIVMLGARVPGERHAPPDTGRHIGLPLPAETTHDVGADLRVRPPSQAGMPQTSNLSTVVQWFKTMTTNDYMRGVRDFGYPPFDRRLWQRNYYEHIIRGAGGLDRVRACIDGNPERWDEDEENPARFATT
jgi:putative transposase